MKQKTKRLIAGLPSGVSVSKHTVGGNRTMFRVVLGKRFTKGKIHDKHFTRLEAARKWLDEQISHHDQLTAVALSPSQIAEAKKAFDELDGSGISLPQAIAFALKHGPRKTRRRFEELTAEFLSSREKMDCEDQTMTNYRSKIRIMTVEFGGAMMDAITTRRIEEWLDDQEHWGKYTKRNYLIDLHAFFEYAISLDYCTQNPVKKVAKPFLQGGPPGILSPGEAERLLCMALEHDPEMVWGITIQLFAGVRRSEVCALETQYARTEYVEIPEAVSKTGVRRLIDVNPALTAWLQCAPAPGKNVTPSKSPDVYGDRLSKLAEKAEIAPWPHNALRHSFGSYHAARDRHIGSTAIQMGNSPAIVMKHYRAVVEDAESKAFWSIRPSEPSSIFTAMPAPVTPL